MSKPEKPFNSRGYQGKLEREVILGGVLIAIIVGGGIIALLWGREASITALGCIALALGLGAVLWLVLKFFEIVSRD